MRKFMILSVIFLVVGCSEDSVTPTVVPFAVNLTVTDTAGEPMSGIEARVHVKIPGINPGLNKSVTKVRFGLATACSVTMNIHDMEGQEVKTISVDDAPAGQHTWTLALDEEGVPPGGTALYRFELVASDSTGELFRDSKIMTEYESFDFDQRPIVGVSDDLGRIQSSDKTRYPFLYELGPQPGLDENSDPIGEFDFSNLIAFTLVDNLTDEFRTVEVVVGAGSNNLTLVWDDSAMPKASEFESVSGAEILSRDVPILPPEFFLDQNYPNPFN